MKSTVTVRLPYKKSINSDGSIDVAYEASRFNAGFSWLIFGVTLLVIGGGGWVVGLAAVTALHISYWWMALVTVLAFVVPIYCASKIVSTTKTITIIPRQGIRFDGKQLAFADMDSEHVSVEFQSANYDYRLYYFTAMISGVKIKVGGGYIPSEKVADPIAQLINEHTNIGLRLKELRHR